MKKLADRNLITKVFSSLQARFGKSKQSEV